MAPAGYDREDGVGVKTLDLRNHLHCISWMILVISGTRRNGVIR